MPDVQMCPSAVTIDRIRRACRQLELTVCVGDRGDLCVLLFPHVFHVVAEESKPFVGFGIFHRYVDVKHSEMASQLVRQHNRDFYSPKLFTVVSDEGKILFQLSHTFGWDPHAADEQISAEIDAFLGSAVETFAGLGDAFPDEWSLSSPAGETE